MTNRTASAAAAELTALNAQDFVVHAKDMLHAQSFTASAEERAHLTAKADLIREITSSTAKVNVPVRVQDNGHIIGQLVFSL